MCTSTDSFIATRVTKIVIHAPFKLSRKAANSATVEERAKTMLHAAICCTSRAANARQVPGDQMCVSSWSISHLHIPVVQGDSGGFTTSRYPYHK